MIVAGLVPEACWKTMDGRADFKFSPQCMLVGFQIDFTRNNWKVYIVHPVSLEECIRDVRKAPRGEQSESVDDEAKPGPPKVYNCHYENQDVKTMCFLPAGASQRIELEAIIGKPQRGRQNISRKKLKNIVKTPRMPKEWEVEEHTGSDHRNEKDSTVREKWKRWRDPRPTFCISINGQFEAVFDRRRGFFRE